MLLLFLLLLPAFCGGLLELVFVGLGVMKLESGVAEEEEEAPDEDALEHWDDSGELGAVLDGDAEDRSRV